MGATAITLSFNARISIGLFVAISIQDTKVSSLVIYNSSFDLLTPQMQPNLLRALLTSIRTFSTIDVVPNQTSDDKIALKLVFTLKFSPFQNDIKGWFSTFISHFPHDSTMALIVYAYKAQTQLFLVNFMKRDYIYFDCIDE